MKITRKEFLLAGVGVVSASILVACGGGGDEDDDPCTNGTSITFTDQHGHEINVTLADITAGAAKTYTTTGTADHTHTVSFTGPQLASLLTGTQVMATSSSASEGLAHTHSVRVRCV
jgi:hypothetical protein